MLKAKRKKLYELSREELHKICLKLCFDKLKAMPVTNGVKVFARLHESGVFSFARHRNDLGSHIVTSREIASRMNSTIVSSVMMSALLEFEKAFSRNWPFIQGSSSWLQLEISSPEMSQVSFNDKPYLLIRKPVRISTQPKLDVSSSDSINNLFKVFFSRESFSLDNFELLIAPSKILNPILNKDHEIFERFSSDLSFTREKFADLISESVMSENFEAYLNPQLGFYIEESGVELIVSKSNDSSGLEKEKNVKMSFPLPIGLIR